MIQNLDHIELLRQIRILHVWQHKVAVSVEALKRLAHQNGFGGVLADLEKAVSKETEEIHAQTLHSLDEEIQRISHGL